MSIPPRVPPPRQKEPEPWRCPKCRQIVELLPTGDGHEDTAGNRCEVFICPTDGCGYEEGRPVV